MIYVLLTFPVRSTGVVVADAVEAAALAAAAVFGSSFRRFWGGGGVARAAAALAFSETLDVRLVATFGSAAPALLVAEEALVEAVAAPLVDVLAAAALSFFSDRTTRDELDAFTDGSQLFELVLSAAVPLDCFEALATAAVDFFAALLAAPAPPFAFFFFLSFLVATLASAPFTAFSVAAAAGVD